MNAQLLAQALMAAANVLMQGAQNAAQQQVNAQLLAQQQYVPPQQQYVPPQQQQQQQQPQQQYVPPQSAPDVTEEQLMALITPHVSNETIKAALGVAMRSLGVSELPNARPDQYGALYQAFQGVINQYTQMAGGAVSGGGGSII